MVCGRSAITKPPICISILPHPHERRSGRRDIILNDNPRVRSYLQKVVETAACEHRLAVLDERGSRHVVPDKTLAASSSTLYTLISFMKILFCSLGDSVDPHF